MITQLLPALNSGLMHASDPIFEAIISDSFPFSYLFQPGKPIF